MISSALLQDKLRKIEALFAGAGTPGERNAAEAALARLRARLAERQAAEPAIEFRFSLVDEWSRRLFLALCRRYGLEPYRLRRQRHTTVMVRIPTSFCEQILWPEFEALDTELRRYLAEVTETLIRDAVFADSSEATEIDQALLRAD
ncbi:MAG: hypothetical protein KDE35_13065 [Geminicoccaceae bacterium]|nr:hypothetical protein [Geminicoccaceae bacterium]